LVCYSLIWKKNKVEQLHPAIIRVVIVNRMLRIIMS
jgi:hypothetical protein